MTGPGANSFAMRPLSCAAIPACMLNVLESLRYGAFLLDLRGRVLSLNMIAFGCLGDGLVLGGEHLSATDRDTDHRLQYVVGSALKSGSAPMSSVAVRRHARLPLVLRIVRLGDDAPQTPGSPRLLLLALDPELRPEPPRDI